MSVNDQGEHKAEGMMPRSLTALLTVTDELREAVARKHTDQVASLLEQAETAWLRAQQENISCVFPPGGPRELCTLCGRLEWCECGHGLGHRVARAETAEVGNNSVGVKRCIERPRSIEP